MQPKRKNNVLTAFSFFVNSFILKFSHSKKCTLLHYDYCTVLIWLNVLHTFCNLQISLLIRQNLSCKSEQQMYPRWAVQDKSTICKNIAVPRKFPINEDFWKPLKWYSSPVTINNSGTNDSRTFVFALSLDGVPSEKSWRSTWNNF
jgi:hypothetical protein